MAHPRKVEPEKYCDTCGIRLERKRMQTNGRLEDLGVFKRRKHCSLSCANTKEGNVKRGTYHWRARKHRKSSCEACGLTDQLHAHHVDGNRKNNEAENIQTLCVFCHNFLHALADRLGWTAPGRLPRLIGWTDLEDSEMQ